MELKIGDKIEGTMFSFMKAKPRKITIVVKNIINNEGSNLAVGLIPKTRTRFPIEAYIDLRLPFNIVEG